MDQGVVVINIDNRLDPALLKSKGISVPFVGPDNRKGARLVGDYLANEKLKAGDQVGIIEGVPTTTNAQQRTAGFKDAMEAAQIKIVSVQSGNWEIDKGNAVAASMLNEYPDLKALLAGNDSMALAPCRLCVLLAKPARCKWWATITSTPSSRCSPMAVCSPPSTRRPASRRCTASRRH